MGATVKSAVLESDDPNETPTVEVTVTSDKPVKLVLTVDENVTVVDVRTEA